MSHTYVWHDSFVHVAWLFQMCGITYFYAWRDAVILVQPVPAKTRLQMVIEMQNGILNSQGYSFISNKPFEKRPRVSSFGNELCLRRGKKDIVGERGL